MYPKISIVLLFLGLYSCKPSDSKEIAQQIVDDAIEACGGDRYETRAITFDFRDRHYRWETVEGQRVMERIFTTDSGQVTDRIKGGRFQRFLDGRKVVVEDSMANNYRNSVNSVHYFAYLPYKLNDAAVNKEFLGRVRVHGREYDKVQVTFDQKNGGEDFRDVFVYWFNRKTKVPDYIAYEYYGDETGMRFREAFNERRVNGIRFADYKNYVPINPAASLYQLDSLFVNGGLKMLSEIRLETIKVR